MQTQRFERENDQGKEGFAHQQMENQPTSFTHTPANDIFLFSARRQSRRDDNDAGDDSAVLIAGCGGAK